jgi:hypothetical protein
MTGRGLLDLDEDCGDEMAMTVVLLSHSLLREGNKDSGVAEGWG